MNTINNKKLLNEISIIKWLIPFLNDKGQEKYNNILMDLMAKLER